MEFSGISLRGEIVQHTEYGKGVITDQIVRGSEQGSIITVDFSGVEKKFSYPASFEEFLTFENKAIVAALRNDLTLVKDIEKRKKEASEKRANAVTLADLKDYEGKTKAFSQKKENIAKRKNIALKCNYNDGGKTESRIGFHGVCSDATIKNNITKEKRSWCTQSDCACLQYFNGEITREQLDAICQDGGWVCYESQMLREWKAMAGMVTQGARRGEPMKMRYVQKNSLAVLTTRTSDSEKEADRFVFAIFLVDEFGEGNSKNEGYVSTESIYKLTFSEEECKKLPFWKYHSNVSNPTKPAWGSGLFRYITDEEAVQILRDVVEVKKGTPEEKLATEFLEYFCTVNGIDSSAVDIARGALQIR